MKELLRRMTIPAAPQGGWLPCRLLLSSLFSQEYPLLPFRVAIGTMYMHAHTFLLDPRYQEDLMLHYTFRFAAANISSFAGHLYPKNPNIGLGCVNEKTKHFSP